MNVSIFSVPFNSSKRDVKSAIAKAAHSAALNPSGHGRKANFDVCLNQSGNSGFLTFETASIGQMFLAHANQHPIEMDGRTLRFKQKEMNPKANGIASELRKTPFVDPDPDVEKIREDTIHALDEDLYLQKVQIGFLHYPFAEGPLEFSVEWEPAPTQSRVRLDYEKQAFEIMLGDDLKDEEGSSMVLPFTSVQAILTGRDVGEPYICFDARVPPALERYALMREKRGNNFEDFDKFKDQVSSLDNGHRIVAQYAWQIRLVLTDLRGVDPVDRFVQLCATAEVPGGLINPSSYGKVETVRRQFFTERRILALCAQFIKLPWVIGFQLEALLRSGLVHTDHLDRFLPEITNMTKEYDPSFVGSLLRNFNERLLQEYRGGRALIKDPMLMFLKFRKAFHFTQPVKDEFYCYHVTVTPTRLLLQGPYPTESNRVIRKYPQWQDHFIRVEFRDEERLQYRWDDSVDPTSFLEERLGTWLKKGFILVGRRFEYLGYSNSSLGERAVWYMSPFRTEIRVDAPLIDGEYIRASIGDFTEGPPLQSASLYGARLGQAFTATVDSVKLRRCEWEVMEDLGEKPYLHTDGVGTISRRLAERVQAALSTPGDTSNGTPDAIQIRFLGFKGVVAIDEELDKRADGIQMRLRPSMNKFNVTDADAQEATLEVAKSFRFPHQSHLNKPLIMLLEGRGVRTQAFLELQDSAVENAKMIDQSIAKFTGVLSDNNLGGTFRIKETLTRVQERYGMDLAQRVDNPFLRRLRDVALVNILREIRHDARITIPGSYHVVGVADEGPAYKSLPGYEKVFCLGEDEIFLCIQEQGESTLQWISGRASISRSPITHSGDVQIVRAIGEPPEDKQCLFRHLKNIVVMPSVGKRSLASCLGGGDLDGDEFDIITLDKLLPTTECKPADYSDTAPPPTGQNWTVEDVCDSIVQYVQFDMIGLLSNRLLVIADQSWDGMHDSRCLKLAKLCSQAVDFPKKGNPVNIDKKGLPSSPLKMKPDWDLEEAVSPGKRVKNFYFSNKALGHLYRRIPNNYDYIGQDESQPILQFRWDPLTRALLVDMTAHLGKDALIKKPTKPIDDLFKRYVEELTYITAAHTLSSDSGPLMEAEVVVGAILAKCSQKRWRKDRMYRMRQHAETLVKDIRNKLLGDANGVEDTKSGLTRAWDAWLLTLPKRNEFGANSFSLIALGVIFDCLDSLPPVARSA